MSTLRPPRIASALAVLCLVFALAACGSDKKDAKKTTRPPTTGATASTGAALAQPKPKPAKCVTVPKPKPKTAKQAKVPRPTLRLDPKATNDVVLDTSCGTFTIRLDVKQAPKTAASFAYLAKRGFYNDLTFNRVSPGFVIQGGDPLDNRRGGPGYRIVEPPPPTATYPKYTVAMAKTDFEDPGTSGSQFFVVTVDDSGLDAQYALVGKVTQGTDVVDLISTAQIDPATERPLKPVVIQKARLVTSKSAAAKGTT